MSILDKKVKEIRIYKNGTLFNKNHNMAYKMKKYMEIEFFNGKIIKLSLDSNADITSCDYLEITNKGKLVKVFFKSELA